MELDQNPGQNFMDFLMDFDQVTYTKPKKETYINYICHKEIFDGILFMVRI